MSKIKLRQPLATQTSDSGDGVGSKIDYQSATIDAVEKSYLVHSITIVFLIVVTILVLAITAGAPARLSDSTQAQATANQSLATPNAFAAMDLHDLPAPDFFTAQDGHKLAYRTYHNNDGAWKGSVILVHDAGMTGKSMHLLAKAFAENGYVAYAMDMRGHGESGTQKSIAYVGQLEDDIEDFLMSVKPEVPRSLVGYSAGGGFALRMAANKKRQFFSNYLLLTPLLGNSSIALLPEAKHRFSFGTARDVALLVLNSIGVDLLNQLTVMNIATQGSDQKNNTMPYSYVLAESFLPHRDYAKDIKFANEHLEVLVGDKDEWIEPDKLAYEFKSARAMTPVYRIPGLVRHSDIVTTEAALKAAVSAINRLNIGPTIKVRMKPQKKTDGKN